MNPMKTNELLFAFTAILSILIVTGIINNYIIGGIVEGQTVNVTELDTLDRMRYTAIQMTIIDLQNTSELSNLTNDQIASEIYQYQKHNDSIDKLTTIEIENLYRNMTQQR